MEGIEVVCVYTQDIRRLSLLYFKNTRLAGKASIGKPEHDVPKSYSKARLKPGNLTQLAANSWDLIVVGCKK